jgi:hypothetical protein
MEYQIRLTQQEVQLILAALGELPLKLTMSAFANINAQVIQQDQAKAVDLSSIVSGEQHAA